MPSYLLRMGFPFVGRSSAFFGLREDAPTHPTQLLVQLATDSTIHDPSGNDIDDEGNIHKLDV